MWEELYEQYYKELVGYGIRMCADEELAQDLAQETFIRALMHAHTVEELSAAKQRAWLYRTFKNLFFDRFRRAVLEKEYAQSLPSEYEEGAGIQRIETAALLQSIKPRERAIFQLRYLDGYSAEEIAKMMRLPPGTVRSILSRCRKHLKQTLEL